MNNKHHYFSVLHKRTTAVRFYYICHLHNSIIILIIRRLKQWHEIS